MVMTDAWATVIAALVSATPLLLATGVLAALAIRHRSALSSMLERTNRIGVAGVFDLELDTDAIKDAREDAPLTNEQATAVDRRVQRAAELLQGARLLWVDDAPGGNLQERRYLRSAGMVVVNATATAEALTELNRFDFDVVITDMDRPESATAGTDLVVAMRAAGHWQLVIGYIGRVDPALGTPVEFFGITDRPDQLVHLIIDALERVPRG